jgi:hypothetical protein
MRCVLELLSGLVVPLLPISWMFLIIRSVHAESLVGDRQFWVTRPYRWNELLLSKVLFILAFVNLPLFLADGFLLTAAGFRPSSHLVGLLWLQLIWILILFLPATALATVTRSIGQFLLALLFILLYIIAMGAISSAVPNSDFHSYNGGIYILLIVATSLAVIIVQYSRRKTFLSRWLIGGFAIVLALLLVATPYRILIEHEFPLASGNAAPVQLSLLPSKAPAPEYAAKFGNVVPIHMPFRLSGLPAGSFVELKGRMLSLTNAQGAHWSSGWESSSMLLFPDQKTTNIEIYMKKDAFERMKASPVHAQVLLAFTLFHDKNPRSFVIPAGEFTLPDVGFCTASAERMGNLVCRVPLRNPRFLLFTSDAAASTCPLGKNETRPNPGELARGSLRNESGDVEPGISPIHIERVYLSDWAASSNLLNPGICPGTPLTLSDPEEAGRSRIELQFDNLSLADYQQGANSPAETPAPAAPQSEAPR